VRTSLGCQRATTRLLPQGTRDTSAVELAKFVGMDLFPWQREILSESARLTGDRWSAFEVGAIVPRQSGKSFLIVARALAGALLYGEKLTVYSAHEYRTAMETWRLMRSLCESDALARHVKQVRVVAGGETVEFNNGARFKMIARTKSSGRGFSPDCLLLDEAFSLNGEVMASVLPSMSARPNPQVYYFSSAGTWQSEVLLGIRRRGHNPTTRRLAFWDWYADPADDIRSESTWRKANPSYGYLVHRDSIERELESMSKRSFQRERLGIWTESFAETVFDEDEIEFLTVDAPKPPTDGRSIGWGVDVDRDRSGAAIVACFTGDDGHPVMVLVDQRPGAGWVPERLGQLQERYGADGFAYDAKGGINDLMDRADRDFGVYLQPLKHNDYPSACAGLVQDVSDKRVRFGRAPLLTGDLVTATSKAVSNGWVWQRAATTEPIRLIAATCARFALDHGSGASGVGIF
jgi:hypothetical protein